MIKTDAYCDHRETLYSDLRVFFENFVPASLLLFASMADNKTLNRVVFGLRT